MLGAIARYVSRHHVALLALFVALGGSAVAATFINGKSIKPHTLLENPLDATGGRFAQDERPRGLITTKATPP
jgi:hypothetical protein